MVQQTQLITTYFPFTFLYLSMIIACLAIHDETMLVVSIPFVVGSVKFITDMWSIDDSTLSTGNYVERFLWASVSYATLFIFQGVYTCQLTNETVLQIFNWVSIFSIPIYLVVHMTGERTTNMLLMSMCLTWNRTPHFINIIAFVFTLTSLLIIQLSKISKMILIFDRTSSIMPILRISHLLHLPVELVAIGLIHITIEFYRRHVPTNYTQVMAAADTAVHSEPGSA